MKPYLKAAIFLILLTVLDFLLRKGFVAFMIPIFLSQHLTILLLFVLFAALSWYITKWFCQRDQCTLRDLGISLDWKNRIDFLYGLIVGVGLWAIVSLLQSIFAGFSWEWRSDFSPWSIFYGLIFIFIADLGTELYTRGYPLTRFKDSLGTKSAILIMVLFVGLKSYSPGIQGELLLYTMLIPALHTVFFSIIYFLTGRLGAALGLHAGANFITISIFDMRVGHPGQAIPSGMFQPGKSVESLSLTALQLPWVFMAVALSFMVYFLWRKKATG